MRLKRYSVPVQEWIVALALVELQAVFGPIK